MPNIQQAIDRITAGYIEAVLQLETDESDDSGGLPLSYSFDAEDFHVDSYNKMRNDCAIFYSSAADLIDSIDMEPEEVGRNFYLDRQGHGTGFWDRALGAAGEELTNLAREFGEFHVWIGDHVDYGDDGKLHGEAA